MLPRKRLLTLESRVPHLHHADIEAVLLVESSQRLVLQVNDDRLHLVAHDPQLAFLRDLRH